MNPAPRTQPSAPPSERPEHGRDARLGSALKALPTGAVIRRLLALVWRYRAGCVAVLTLQLALLAITLGGLSLVGLGIDYIHHAADPSTPPPRWPFGLAPSPATPAAAALAIVASLICGVALIRSVLTFAAQYGNAWLVQRGIVANLRAEVYDKLQRLSFRFFDANSSGAIIGRLAGDVQAVRAFVDGVVGQIVLLTVSLTLYIAYMLRIHAGLTLACLATTPILAVLTVRFSRAVRPAYRDAMERRDTLILRLSESVRGIHVIKGFCREPETIERWREANAALRDRNRSIFHRVSRFGPATGLVANANLLILLGYGGWLYMNGRIPLGAGLVVFVTLLERFAGQVATIADIANTIEHSLTSARRVFEILDTPPEVRNLPTARAPGRLRGRVRFEDVSFAYEPGSPVLSDVSFDVQPGTCVGILGHTAAGKSTLLSLIPRFYDPRRGRVEIDGTDARDWDLDGLRRNVGIVFQQSFLFSNTVAANIAFGKPDATPADIERAARLACAHDFILQLPYGYATILREEGADLSGGQRQRIAIARAILTDPAILLLDDPTAAVDSHTEAEILAAIESAMRGRTTFLVTHRIAALRRADRILSLRNGRVVQDGTHAELMRVPGPYRRCVRIQIDEESREALETGERERGAA